MSHQDRLVALIEQWRRRAIEFEDMAEKARISENDTTAYAVAARYMRRCASELADLTAALSTPPGEQKDEDLSRMDSSTHLAEQRATASTVAPDSTAKPYFWMFPNPAGVSRQLMTAEEVAAFLREMPSYCVAGEGIEATLVFMTDAEVEALPNV